MQSLNFKCCKTTWARCQKFNFVRQGRIPISDDYIETIQHHLEGLSHVSSNRTIKSVWKNKDNLREDILVRYRHLPMSVSYNTYPFKDDMSYSSYYKYIGN